MPRNIAGVYTLPPTINPVVPDTKILSSWANTTLADIAETLTSSLDAAGRGAATAPIKFASGSLLAPGMTFAGDENTGIWRPGEDRFAIVAGGIQQAIYENAKQPPGGFCPLGYGAKGDGVTDDSAAWVATAAAVVTASAATAAEFGQTITINGQGRIYMIKNRTPLVNLDGVRIINCMFRFMPGGDITTTNPMLVLPNTCKNTVFDGCIFDGGKAGAILSMVGASCQVTRCIFYHFKGYGVEITVSGGGDRAIYDCLINEWNIGDAEFSNNANYTAEGVVVDDFDSRLVGSIVRFSKCNVHVKRGGFEITDSHLYNGGAGYVLKTNADNLITDATAGRVRIKNSYLDNGQQKHYDHDVSYTGCYMFLDDARVTLVDGFITLYANGDAAPTGFYAGGWSGMSNNLRANNVVPLVKLMPFGANTWGVNTLNQESWTSQDREFACERAIIDMTATTRSSLTIIKSSNSYDNGGMIAFADSTTLLTPREEMPSLRLRGERLYARKLHKLVLSRNTSLVNITLDELYSGTVIAVFGTAATTLTIHIPQTMKADFYCEVIVEDAVTVSFVEDGLADIRQAGNSAGPWSITQRYGWASVQCTYNVSGNDANVRLTGDVV